MQKWRLKTAEFTAVGDEVLNLTDKFPANEINIAVKAGTVEIEGDNLEPKNIFGATIGESAVIVPAGSSYNLNEEQYEAVTITIKAGATVSLSANL